MLTPSWIIVRERLDEKPMLLSMDERRKGNMVQNPVTIFVCEHGAAKSIIAATYFNKLAYERNLNVRAIARGTSPDAELSPKTIAGLQVDGLSPADSVPQILTLAEAESAERIISFCELPAEYHNKTSIEQWDGIPPVSENYQTARDAILEQLNKLLKTWSF